MHWLGHFEHLLNEHLVKGLYGARSRGSPRLIWVNTIEVILMGRKLNSLKVRFAVVIYPKSIGYIG